MTRITLDNGDVILYERFDKAEVIDNEEIQTSILKITGICSPGQELDELKFCIEVGFPESGPQAIRTIEFLP